MLTVKAATSQLQRINNEISLLNEKIAEIHREFPQYLTREIAKYYGKLLAENQEELRVYSEQRSALRVQQNSLLLALADDEQRLILKRVLQDAKGSADAVEIQKHCVRCQQLRLFSDFRLRPYSRTKYDRLDVCRPCESAARKERRHRKEREAQ